MKTKLIALACLAALWLQSLPTSAQQKTPDDAADEVVRITTNLVQIDAVVTDKKGRHVPDLKQEEFEIYENGRRQEITNFSYVASGEYEATSPTPAGDKNAPPAPPVALRPEQVRRTIALVVDDLGLSFESMAYVRDALKRFVERELQPGDVVAVMRTSAGSGQLQQFTADRRRLAAAVESVRWRGWGRNGGLSSFNLLADDQDLLSGSRAQAQANGRRGEGVEAVSDSLDDFREDLFAVGTLGALNSVVLGMREMPGRKSILLMSDGIDLFTPEGLNQRVLAALQRLTDLANRASVVLYAMDARGLPTLGVTAADDTSRLSAQQISDLPRLRRQQYRNSQEGLFSLADQTGGFFVRNTNDLAGGIRRVINDQRGYYLIGYRPEAATFDATSGRAKFHRLEVKVTRPGVSVRSRTGFYGISDEEARPAAPLTRKQQLSRALLSPFGAGDVGVRLTPLFGHDAQAGSFMRALLHIDAKNLTFTEEADGWRKAVIDVAAVTLGAGGQFVDEADREHTIKMRGETYQKAMNNGLLYTFLVPIKKSGAYQLHMAVRDAPSERVGSASQFIEVPDVGKDRLALSGIVLQGEHNAPPGKAPETPALAAGENSAEQETAPEASPAVRRLRAGMNLVYSLLIYNARIDRATNQPQLRTQLRLFRDGQMIFAGQESLLPTPASTDAKQIPVGGRLRLGDDMKPGPYVLQVVVTDTLAKGQRRTQTQWMDFEVTSDK